MRAIISLTNPAIQAHDSSRSEGVRRLLSLWEIMLQFRAEQLAGLMAEFQILQAAGTSAGNNPLPSPAQVTLLGMRGRASGLLKDLGL